MGFYWNSFLIHSCHVGIDTELVKSACSWRQSGEEGDNSPQLFHLSIWVAQTRTRTWCASHLSLVHFSYPFTLCPSFLNKYICHFPGFPLLLLLLFYCISQRGQEDRFELYARQEYCSFLLTFS